MKNTCILLSFLLLAGCLPGKQTWQKHIVMQKGANMTLAPADYNGDGRIDIITSYKRKVSLFLAPSWKETVLFDLGKANYLRCIHGQAMDIDNDGDMDYIGGSGKGAPFWLENPGTSTGNWVARTIDDSINGLHCILKADIDKDGQLDLVINNFRPEGPLGSSIAWYPIPKDVKNTQQWPRYVLADKDAGGGSHYFGFGDLDGDGFGELAIGTKGAPFDDGNYFAYWKHDPQKGITAPWQKVMIADKQLAATNILPGDINGDGVIDYLASRGHSSGVIWFEGPNWIERTIDPELKSPHALELVDLDQDGDLDAASCGFESKRLSIYLNDGNGNFERIDLDLDQESYDLRAVDMDGDGDLDLVNAGRGTGNVAWYENPLK